MVGDVPALLNCKLISLNMSALITGAKYRGEFEERRKAVLKEVKDSGLFIDEMRVVFGTGQTTGVANLLKLMFARGEVSYADRCDNIGEPSACGDRYGVCTSKKPLVLRHQAEKTHLNDIRELRECFSTSN